MLSSRAIKHASCSAFASARDTACCSIIFNLASVFAFYCRWVMHPRRTRCERDAYMEETCGYFPTERSFAGLTNQIGSVRLRKVC